MSHSKLQSHFFDSKGCIAVITAVRMAYARIKPGDEFYGSQIAKDARHLTMRQGLYIDSAIRKLRLMRENGEANFVCIDQIDSKYLKIS